MAEIADHPEITLSRRDILRFILVEPTKRSEEIQALLKLDEIGQTRSALNAAQNRLQAMHATATAQVNARRSALTLHLQISTPRAEDLLGAVNKRRKVLDLPAILELGQKPSWTTGSPRRATRRNSTRNQRSVTWKLSRTPERDFRASPRKRPRP